MRYSETMSVTDLITYLAALATIVGTIYTGLSYHRSNSLNAQGRSILLIFLNLIIVISAWLAVWYNHQNPITRDNNSDQFVLSWGLTPQGAYYAIFNGNLIHQYAKTEKLMLILRVGFADRDKSTDQEIEKSSVYSIVDGAETLAHPPSMRLRFLVGFPNNLEFDIVVIPNDISADKILSLSDVELLGGKLLASAGMNITGGASQSSPSTPN